MPKQPAGYYSGCPVAKTGQLEFCFSKPSAKTEFAFFEVGQNRCLLRKMT